jgi:hypothetical protein
MVPSWHPAHFGTTPGSRSIKSSGSGGNANIMSFSSESTESHRQTLLNGVLDAVKRCQEWDRFDKF